MDMAIRKMMEGKNKIVKDNGKAAIMIVGNRIRQNEISHDKFGGSGGKTPRFSNHHLTMSASAGNQKQQTEVAKYQMKNQYSGFNFNNNLGRPWSSG